MSGTLLLLPSLLGATVCERVLPAGTLIRARATEHFLAENAKTARAFLKAIGHPRPLAQLPIVEIGHQPDMQRIDEWLAPALAGHDIALLSEAGCPGVADPGAEVVARAHALGLRVQPLVGPSSILLALMAAGMNGQRFCFVGYLPQETAACAAAIRNLERRSADGETQLFIETPYRNEQLLRNLLEHCSGDTRLAIAVDLTTDDERVTSLPIAQWRSLPAEAGPLLQRRPAVFALLAAQARQPANRRAASGRASSSGRQ